MSDFTQGVVVFSSQVAGSIKIRKDTERIISLLSARKVDHSVVDISVDEAAKEYLKERNGGKVSLPQVFVNGELREGGLEKLEEANEDGQLIEFLGIAA